MEDLSKYHILVISDDSDILASTEEFLALEGFVVLTATSGLEALNRARMHPVDLVVVDLSTPRLDARGILQEIRKKRPLLPSIMISASRDEDKVAKAFASGKLDAVIKPSDLKDLKNMILTRLRSR